MEPAKISVLLTFQMQDTWRQWPPFALLAVVICLGYNLPLLQNAFVSDSSHKESARKVGLVGGSELIRSRMANRFEVVPMQRVDEQAIVNGEVSAILNCPSRLGADSPETKTPQGRVQLYSGRTRRSETVAKELLKELQEVREDILDKRVTSAGIGERWRLIWKKEDQAVVVAHPLDQLSVSRSNVARSAALLTFAIVSFVGTTIGSAFAEDKNRNLELISPVARSNFVIANFLYACFVSSFFVLLGLSARMVADHLFAGGTMAFATVPFLLVCVPHVILVSSVMAYVSTFIQTQGDVVNISLIATGIEELLCAVLFVPVYNLPAYVYLIPFSNNALLMRDSLTGPLDWFNVGACVVVSAACSLLLLRMASLRMDRTEFALPD